MRRGVRWLVTVSLSALLGCVRGGMYMFVRWMGGLVSSFSVCDSICDAGILGGCVSVKFWDSWM